MGKGDKRRPENKKQFDENYDRITWNVKLKEKPNEPNSRISNKK